MQNSPAVKPDSYFAPEIVELGSAGALTLGQRDLPYADGCQCAKSCADAELVADVGC